MQSALQGTSEEMLWFGANISLVILLLPGHKNVCVGKRTAGIVQNCCPENVSVSVEIVHI